MLNTNGYRVAEKLWRRQLFSSYHRRAVAQPCVNGDRLSQWRMAKFDPSQIRNLSTDQYKI